MHPASRRRAFDAHNGLHGSGGAGRRIAPDNDMERTRFFRRPVVWFIIVILGAIAASTLFTGGASYKKVDSAKALALLNSGSVKKALLEDKEQTLNLDLKQNLNGTTK